MLFVGVAIVTLSGGCRSLPTDTADVMTLHFDFDEGPLGFVAGFADYPPAHEEIYELTSGHRTLPPPLELQSGLFLSGVNRSDDLFMFFKGPIAGLTPGANYAVEVGVEIATSTPSGCVGVGGAPGESVWIKAGVTAEEPVAVMEDTYLRMNIDIGNQSNGGTQAVSAGQRGQLAVVRTVCRMGTQGPGEAIDTGGHLRTRRWPRLAPDGRRFGIREPDGCLFHSRVGHADAESGGMIGDGCC